MQFRYLGLLILCCFLGGELALGGVPKQISYQGRLTQSSGSPVSDNVYSMKFRIYDASNGGSVLWTSDGYVPILVVNGLFNYLLGTAPSLPDSLMRFDSLWLGVTVGLDSEIQPRTSLASVPFSFKSVFSETSQHSDSSSIALHSVSADSATNSAFAVQSSFADSATYADTADVVRGFININVPVGTILGWLKNFGGTPALPSNFVECNGQTLSDVESVFHGNIIPDLNGQISGIQRFLRGSTLSGATGGEDYHTLTIAEMPSHNHAIQVHGNATGASIAGALGNALVGTDGASILNTGGGGAHENRPSYYEVVWIMRIK